MKGTIFNRPLEWNIETTGESWNQGDTIKGILRVKNHGTEIVSLLDSGVALAYADIKKVHARSEGALKIEAKEIFQVSELKASAETQLDFSFLISPNSPVTDKKASYYLAFGKNFNVSHLMLQIAPKALYSKVVGLMDTFQRFKVKEIKAVKKGVEYKLLPPTSREMANIESLLLTFSMLDDNLKMKFDFQVKKLDTSSITTKVNKESVSLEKTLSPKEYSLGRDMIHQDVLLKVVEGVLSEVKLKTVF